jgi:hypothetical protein
VIIIGIAGNKVNPINMVHFVLKFRELLTQELEECRVAGQEWSTCQCEHEDRMDGWACSNKDRKPGSDQNVAEQWSRQACTGMDMLRL